MDLSQPDRRSTPRYAVDTEATVVLVNRGPSLCGRLVELSLDGCRLRADRYCALAAPAPIEVMFKVNGIDFRLGGTMQWAEAQQMAGIQFGPMARRRRDFLVELLAELEAEKAAEASSPAPEECQPEPDGGDEGLADSKMGPAPQPALVTTPSPAPGPAPG